MALIGDSTRRQQEYEQKSFEFQKLRLDGTAKTCEVFSRRFAPLADGETGINPFTLKSIRKVIDKGKQGRKGAILQEGGGRYLQVATFCQGIEQSIQLHADWMAEVVLTVSLFGNLRKNAICTSKANKKLKSIEASLQSLHASKFPLLTRDTVQAFIQTVRECEQQRSFIHDELVEIALNECGNKGHSIAGAYVSISSKEVVCKGKRPPAAYRELVANPPAGYVVAHIICVTQTDNIHRDLLPAGTKLGAGYETIASNKDGFAVIAKRGKTEEETKETYTLQGIVFAGLAHVVRMLLSTLNSIATIVSTAIGETLKSPVGILFTLLLAGILMGGVIPRGLTLPEGFEIPKPEPIDVGGKPNGKVFIHPFTGQPLTEADLPALKAQILELQDINREQNVKLEALEKSLKELGNSFNKSNEEKENLLEQIQDLRFIVRMGSVGNKEKAGEIAKLTSEKTRLNKELEKLNSTLTKEIGAPVRLERANGDHAKGLVLLRMHYAAQLQNKTDEVSQIEKRLTALTNEKELLIAEHAKSGKEAARRYGEVIGQMKDLNASKLELTRQVDGLNGEKLNMESKVKELQSKLNRTEGKLDAANRGAKSLLPIVEKIVSANYESMSNRASLESAFNMIQNSHFFPRKNGEPLKLSPDPETLKRVGTDIHVLYNASKEELDKVNKEMDNHNQNPDPSTADVADTQQRGLFYAQQMHALRTADQIVREYGISREVYNLHNNSATLASALEHANGENIKLNETYRDVLHGMMKPVIDGDFPEPIKVVARTFQDVVSNNGTVEDIENAARAVTSTTQKSLNQGAAAMSELVAIDKVLEGGPGNKEFLDILGGKNGTRAQIIAQLRVGNEEALQQLRANKDEANAIYLSNRALYQFGGDRVFIVNALHQLEDNCANSSCNILEVVDSLFFERNESSGLPVEKALLKQPHLQHLNFTERTYEALTQFAGMLDIAFPETIYKDARSKSEIPTSTLKNVLFQHAYRTLERLDLAKEVSKVPPPLDYVFDNRILPTRFYREVFEITLGNKLGLDISDLPFSNLHYSIQKEIQREERPRVWAHVGRPLSADPVQGKVTHHVPGRGMANRLNSSDSKHGPQSGRSETLLPDPGYGFLKALSMAMFGPSIDGYGDDNSESERFSEEWSDGAEEGGGQDGGVEHGLGDNGGQGGVGHGLGGGGGYGLEDDGGDQGEELGGTEPSKGKESDMLSDFMMKNRNSDFMMKNRNSDFMMKNYDEPEPEFV